MRGGVVDVIWYSRGKALKVTREDARNGGEWGCCNPPLRRSPSQESTAGVARTALNVERRWRLRTYHVILKRLAPVGGPSLYRRPSASHESRVTKKSSAGCTFLHLHGVPVDAEKIIDYFAAKRNGRPMETRGGGSLQEGKLAPFLWAAEWGGPSRPTHLLNQILG